MRKDEKNMFDVENKTELEDARRAYEQPADVSDRKYKMCVFCKGTR